MSQASDPAVSRSIEHRILLLRGERVLLDEDLVRIYSVETKALLQAVRRNRRRFPSDFLFQPTRQEVTALRSQIVTSKARGGRRTLPYAFTEQGVAMLSSVLRSERAAQANVEIMRAFVRLRRLLTSNAELERKLADLEARYDAQFKVVFDAIRRLMASPHAPPRRIGFHRTDEAS